MSGNSTVGVAESAREVCGWRFSCHKAPAMSSAQRYALSAELRLRPAIPLPEVVFADSTLQIEHQASGLAIHFDAKEALHTWIRDHDGDADRWEPSSFDFTYRDVLQRSFKHRRYCLLRNCSSKWPSSSTSAFSCSKMTSATLVKFTSKFEWYVFDATTSTKSFPGLTKKWYYCRIDEKTVKLQDTRYYHEFGDNFIWRDHERRESTTAAVKQILGARHPEQQDAPFELSGDVVYGLLRPMSTMTEKIHLTTSG